MLPRLLTAAVQYKAAKDDKQRQRVLLGLAIEERQVLEEWLQINNPDQS